MMRWIFSTPSLLPWGIDSGVLFIVPVVSMFLRFLADSVLFTAAFFIPWWLAVAWASVLSLRLRHGYELIALGVVLDALYGLPIMWLGGFRFPFTFGCTLLFLVIDFVRPRLYVSLWRERGT